MDYTKNYPLLLFTFLEKNLLVVAALLFGSTLLYRHPHLDDAWLGEQAYWLAKIGVVKSELFRGILDYDRQVFVFHKLFIFLGAMVIKVFGWSLFALKSVSLASLLLFIIIVWHSIDKQKVNRKLFLSLLVINPLIVEFGFVFRPELLLMLLGFLSFLMLQTYCKRNEQRYLFGSAVIAGIAALVHLNGLVFITAAGLFLLISKRVHAAFLFGLLATPIAALYLWDVISADAFDQFLLQFTNDPALSSDDFNPLLKLLREHTRYFHNFSTSIFTLLTISGLYLYHKKYGFDNTLKYFLGLVISLALVVQGTSTKYLILITPISFYMISHVINGPIGSKPIRFTYQFLVLVYLSTGLGKAFDIRKSSDAFVQLNKAIAHQLPKHVKNIIGPTHFIFDQIKDYRIQSLHYYQHFFTRYEEEELNAHNFLKMAEKLNIDAIILPKNGLYAFHLEGLTKLAMQQWEVRDMGNTEILIRHRRL